MVVATGLAGALASCGSSTASPTTTAPGPRTVATTRDLVGLRYCEVLLVHPGPTGAVASVYNTFPLNACPEDKWAALDAKTIAARNGAVLAGLNGPRFWLMDSIQKQRSGHEVIRSFGGIRMILEATVTLGSLAAAGAPYVPHAVDRQTVFTFDAGRQVYELAAPNGTRWVMQAYSQIKDPTLSLADLPGLGSRLQLPAGWTYVVRRLTAPLTVVTTSTNAEVLQDTLSNSYSMETGG